MADAVDEIGIVLGEQWTPVGEVSVESERERIPGIDYPPTSRIHVWFARRPHLTSRLAIIGAIAPPSVSKEDLFSLLALPINRDIVGLFKILVRAKAEKRKIKNPCDWKQSYKVPISKEMLGLINSFTTEKPLIVDPFAGGGSIPLETIRLGLPVIANDLNPVAYICLKGTVEYPAKYGPRLLTAVKEFCDEIHQSALAELTEYYPRKENEEVYAYLWSRTVSCPQCSLEIPLTPHWWAINTDRQKVAIRPIVPEEGTRCSFTVIEDPKKYDFDPDSGTTSGGGAVCLRCHSTMSSDQIKTEAQAGRMGHQLYCVCNKVPKLRGRGKAWRFEAPTQADYLAVDMADQYLLDHKEQLIKENFLPSEEVPFGLKTRELLRMGMDHWYDLFNPRQLMAHSIYLKHFRNKKNDLFSRLTPGSNEWEFATAVSVYGAMVFDSCVDYNSIVCMWDSKRTKIAHTMSLQAFPFKASYSEFDNANMLWPWCQQKTLEALQEIISLLPSEPGSVNILNQNAASLPCDDKSIPVIITDPPYSENVMYAEISDFFYVWLKRLIGDLFPKQFSEDLTNKSDEAVANPARFNGAKRGQSKILAQQDYAAKMEAAFREMHRILTDDGIVCVMFTHRKAEAWEGLAESLMNAGFILRASWPIHTEPSKKFAKVNKGTLKVTVLLYCRKRPDRRPGRWEDVVDEIRETAKEKVVEYQGYGITGPDLLVSLYGPALGRFSEYYPVKDITGRIVRAREALAAVAEVVNEYLTGDIRGADMESLAYLNLLRSAPGLTIETDLARLSTVFGGNTSLDALDVKGGAGLVEKDGKDVKILTARQRLEMGVLSPDRPTSFKGLMDVVHAAILLYERQGIGTVQRMLEEVGRDAHDAGVISVLGAIGAIGEDGSAELVAEARIANALLEALGHTSAGVGKTGERITHWIE